MAHHHYFRGIATIIRNGLFCTFMLISCIVVGCGERTDRQIAGTLEGGGAQKSCVECHQEKTPGIYRDWQASVHAKADVHCDKCHRALDEQSVLVSHLEYSTKPITVVVTPKSCQGCHPEQAAQYARSKHANTMDIIGKVDRWFKGGMTDAIERTTGCLACHGTTVSVEKGEPSPGTWPNVGVGRINPDGSKGSCSSCHTRHRFSVAEARKPEACDQCHLGPDHPQIEIYNESKHGTIYHAEGTRWTWSPSGAKEGWQAGKHYRAPTCATCHMSSIATRYDATHNVTERLAWEHQTPHSVRPQNFEPFPATTDWVVEREKMTAVCLQCHSSRWAEAHFRNMDKVVARYNDEYFAPINQIIENLYTDGLLSRQQYFDEPLEWQFFEFWHFEGRRARMGAAMMAPDYAWWHGFYELKHRFGHIRQMADDLRKSQGESQHLVFPGESE